VRSTDSTGQVIRFCIEKATRRRLTGALVVALAAGAIGVTPSAQSGNSASRDAAESDFYYYRNTRVPVSRSQNEIVVRLVADRGGDTQRVQQMQSFGATLREQIRAEGRTFQILAVDETRGGTAADGSNIAHFRSLSDVDFSAPVYYHAETGSRLLPTDEIIVKLNSGIRRSALNRIAASMGLTVVRPLLDTEDEYILRLERSGDDPLAISRALHEHGAFEWAEPNLMVEYREFDVPNDPQYT
jgi:hypothetical protein